ncbi:hypothetical protein SmJEL517_g02860 [Synchytrium microbalum]|uniref:Prenyltransferase alpha-alpha toroid domain-containing protein n=1 Tax=Synchytrium microbalum TaxID=1806994 RepID=A0A507CAH0_9FUNG|nr:uncharacterized protein SmJEL517_g02860 [Synchytrium microbalum]TPX34505.1 hypothetical protein SmJEL517_g02860 [Synchytrium microbalum]
MTLLYFCLAALDLLGEIDTPALKSRKERCINWIYACQVIGDAQNDTVCGGFKGSTFTGASFDTTKRVYTTQEMGHIAMTYTALACLRILDDDMSRVNKENIVVTLKKLQQPDGSFVPYLGSRESDMRFLYCACAVSTFLNDWRGVNQQAAVSFILNSQNFDGGFAQSPNLESHGGSTYCAIASLSLMSAIPQVLSSPKIRDATIRWLLFRQLSGFNGRPNKPLDTCYSFWIGASLKLLDAYHFVDKAANERFLATTESQMGGFGKEPQSYPDLLHSYLGLAGLAIGDFHDLKSLSPALNIAQHRV